MEALAKSLTTSVPRVFSLCKLCGSPRPSAAANTLPANYINYTSRRSSGLLANPLPPVHESSAWLSTSSHISSKKSTSSTTTPTNCSSSTNRITAHTACNYCSQQVAHASTTPNNCTPLHAAMQTHSAPTTAAVPPAPPRINRRTELDFEELKELQVAGDISLIDVRHPQEIEKHGEIPGSVNIPLCKIKVALQLSEDEWTREFCMEKPCKLDRNLVFYARGPNASSAAVEIAHRLGFKKSRHYIGGWEDYCHQTGVPIKRAQEVAFGPSGNFYHDRFDQYFL